MIDDIDAIITTAIRARIFPGAVIVVTQNNRLLHAAAYGTTMYDDPGTSTVTLDTIYDLASLTKVFTATAALRLHDAGLLPLDRPVQHWLQTCTLLILPFDTCSVTVAGWQYNWHRWRVVE